jgi:hypothetical protein
MSLRVDCESRLRTLGQFLIHSGIKLILVLDCSSLEEKQASHDFGSGEKDGEDEEDCPATHEHGTTLSGVLVNDEVCPTSVVA